MDPLATVGPQLFDAVGVTVGLALFLFAATAESAMVALSRTRVNQLVDHGRSDARRLELFLDQPNRFIVATQVLRTLACVATTAFAAVLATSTWGADPATVTTAAVAVFLLLVLLLSFPRGIAVHDPERTALYLYFPIRASAALLGPVVQLLNRIGGGAAHWLGLARVPDGAVLTADDLHTQASAARETGIIEEGEQDMIDSIIELDKTAAREIMVPRIDVVALPSTATLEEALDVISSKGYSRVPVYEGSIDHIVGVLYAKDLFRQLRERNFGVEIGQLVRPAYFIPESKKTGELLRELQRQKVHIAIVADEYGGTAGIVTIEDLLEEIVGEIQDEYDREEAKIVAIGPNEAIFEATVSIHDVNDTLDLELEGEDVDTIGGLVYERLGKVPALGDTTELDGAVLRVESTAGRRIRKVRVTRRAAMARTAGAA